MLVAPRQVPLREIVADSGRAKIIDVAGTGSFATVKGGGAWESDEYSVFSGALISTASETRTGCTIWGGGEYAFTDSLTGFVEYDFYDFGTKSNTFAGSFGTTIIDIKETKSVAKAGLNIKFGAWH